jgi:hypothetical protein
MKNSVNEELSKIIENYFKKDMTSVYIRHSPSEVDFYRWIPTNEFVYIANIFTVPDSFRLWKSAIDITIEELEEWFR